MISIIMPTYNNSDILSKTIAVVLQQTYKNFELIIVDDASTDNTKSLIKHLGDKRIHYIKHDKQLGTTQARLSGINFSSGEYVAFLDDDDWWNPAFLAMHLECFKKNKNLDFVICDYVINNLITNKHRAVCLEDFYYDFKSNITRQPGPFFQCSMFTKKFIDSACCYFDNKSEPSEDWDFFINTTCLNPKVGYVPFPLFEWNFSSQSQSFNYNNEWAAIEYIITKNKEILLKHNSKNNLSLQYRRLGSYMFQLQNMHKYKHYYTLAFQTHSMSLINILYKLLLLAPLCVQKQIMKNK